MKRWIAFHLQAMERAMRHLRSTPLGSALSVLVIAMAVTLPLLLFAILVSLSGTVERLGDNPHANVFFVTSASTADVQAVERMLRLRGETRELAFIDKDSALKKLKASPSYRDLLSAIEGNPLPHALSFRPMSQDPQALAALRESLLRQPAVETVVMDSEWSQRIVRLIRAGQITGVLLALVLGMAVAFVTGNTIRLQILSRREEIEVSRLIGATQGFIRRPFLYFGSLQGFTAGLLAAAFVRLTLFWLDQEINAIGGLLGNAIELSGSAGVAELVAITAVTFLGWLGAWVAVETAA
ncbi:MAG TPA: permease-like cell division protein FtsX [Usitatibacteraceae bacterium]|nr:permease-like cell division protein FtsX [Usitatibacteraceae bacterium]